jgi:hypothetical protein
LSRDGVDGFGFCWGMTFMRIIFGSLVFLGTLNSAYADMVVRGGVIGNGIVRDGYVWYYDPRTLSREERKVIEIARAFIEKHNPKNKTHHIYGGLIDDDGSDWSVSFYPALTDRTRPSPKEDDIIVYVDKKLMRVTHTLLGQ